MNTHPPRCDGCRYWLKTISPIVTNKSIGFCKRNPPQMIMTPTPQGVVIQGHFPQVLADDWCGEHELARKILDA